MAKLSPIEPLTMKWEHGTIVRLPKGESDIYWCKVSKGPTVYFRKGDESRCQLCHQRLYDDPNVHYFVAHIESDLS